MQKTLILFESAIGIFAFFIAIPFSPLLAQSQSSVYGGSISVGNQKIAHGSLPSILNASAAEQSNCKGQLDTSGTEAVRESGYAQERWLRRSVWGGEEGESKAQLDAIDHTQDQEVALGSSRSSKNRLSMGCVRRATFVFTHPPFLDLQCGRI